MLRISDAVFYPTEIIEIAFPRRPFQCSTKNCALPVGFALPTDPTIQALVVENAADVERTDGEVCRTIG